MKFTALLTFALCTFAVSPLAVQAESSQAFQVCKAFEESMGTDWDSFRSVFANDATIKYCRGSTCTEGSVDEIWSPFFQSLSKWRGKTFITSENDQAFGVKWYNYMETPEGCGELSNGFSVFEFNEQGKVTRQVSTSNTTLRCIPAHLEKVAAEQQ